MPRRRRDATGGLYFHVMNRAAKRALMFHSDEDYQAFEKILHAGTSRLRIALFSYCLMPNHWHLVVSPQVDGQLARFMHWVTTTHARRWQLAHGLDGSGAVYQGRYKALPIKSDEHFLWVCRYVERNPLRADLVGRAEDWRWSSLGCGREVREAVVSQWPVSAPRDWAEWVNTPRTHEELELERFRCSIRRGEPFGDDQWQLILRTRLGLTPQRRRGQPAKQSTVLKK
jgi:putative transposase